VSNLSQMITQQPDGTYTIPLFNTNSSYTNPNLGPGASTEQRLAASTYVPGAAQHPLQSGNFTSFNPIYTTGVAQMAGADSREINTRMFNVPIDQAYFIELTPRFDGQEKIVPDANFGASQLIYTGVPLKPATI
jgi:hypothetical protein